ncbi:MAG: 23S rRNA (pseudouridine(1915)-N(3))-methyltransferase RlmH [Bacteroidia bacterium]|nr:23S rRNA (pseudouridine(1915)-N(3))-methyltransferase RlmH [Bacteroidia bacterium]
MKITLLNIGKTTENHIVEGVTHYQQRIKHYYSFSIDSLVINYKSKNDSEQIKMQEEEAILNKLTATDFVILLDEKGKEFTTREFAQAFNKIISSGQNKQLVFITGGAYGFSKKVYERAQLIISLSKLTFPHQLVRLIFCEQLYRICTVLKGEKYHHD